MGELFGYGLLPIEGVTSNRSTKMSLFDDLQKELSTIRRGRRYSVAMIPTVHLDCGTKTH